MINKKTLLSLEYDKILSLIAEFAVLHKTKAEMRNIIPFSNYREAVIELEKTQEAHKLLFNYGISGVEFFDDITDELDRAKKGSTLNMAELLRVGRLLKSSRIVSNGILSISDSEIKYLPEICERLYCDQYLEKEITSKILADDQMADTASEKLYELRKKIKKLNEQIREKLASYIRSGNKYLQENIVTMRNDRFVIPVKSEHRSQINGFVHDRSQSGSTVFIEPIEVLELNNQLRMTVSEEALEVQAILQDLSHKISLISDKLSYNIENVVELDTLEAKAIYAYKTKSVKPSLTTDKVIEIQGGRHPLIDKDKVVPLNVSFGKNCNYLLITGPNTGGKTVTLKLTGLFVLMAMSGMFLPCLPDSKISFFESVFCDIGDEQSIEQSLSTFSSHIKNLVYITENVNQDSLVLIDEIGAGTDPDEGSALAQAVIEYLLSFKSYGIITTHYSKLKEFAFVDKRIMNASMEFDAQTFEPFYKLSIGTPGTSNAIEISARLGLSEVITGGAYSHLSKEKVSFENVLKEAENMRQKSKEELENYQALTKQIEDEYKRVKAEADALKIERERLLAQAKAESRRVVNEKAEEADELLEQIKEILKKEEITSGDLIKARTLKNRLEDKKYNLEDDQELPTNLKPLTKETTVVGRQVFVKNLSSVGEIIAVNEKRKQIVVLASGMKFTLKESALLDYGEKPKTISVSSVKIKREINSDFKREINVIGLDRIEALIEVEKFIDQAIVSNAGQITIVHGVGMKVLSKAIHDYLRKHKSVKEYRYGSYGEGEHGVTVVTLK